MYVQSVILKPALVLLIIFVMLIVLNQPVLLVKSNVPHVLNKLTIVNIVLVTEATHQPVIVQKVLMILVLNNVHHVIKNV